jgi:hypothetical protein
MANWQRVYATGSQIHAEIVKGVLKERGITAVVLNKKESVYQIHGNYEVMTIVDDVVRALQIIEDEITF